MSLTQKLYRIPSPLQTETKWSTPTTIMFTRWALDFPLRLADETQLPRYARIRNERSFLFAQDPHTPPLFALLGFPMRPAVTELTHWTIFARSLLSTFV